MIRIVVDELKNVHGYYPPAEAKVALARAIVTEFPLLNDVRGALGYVSHF